jgi:hypothetical protein
MVSKTAFSNRSRLGDDLVRSHHFVVLMFEHVAMPDVAKLIAGFGHGLRAKPVIVLSARNQAA